MLDAPVYLRDFTRSNEVYSLEFGRRLREITSHGMDAYIGICGGGNQNIELLVTMGKRPKTVTLVDTEASQLYGFMALAKTLNEFIADPFGKWDVGMDRVATEINRDGQLLVNLVKQDITQFVGGVTSEGKYLIYLSNVIPAYTGVNPLPAILANGNISDGSAILMVGGFYVPLEDTYILVKKNGMFEVNSDDARRLYGNIENIYLTRAGSILVAPLRDSKANKDAAARADEIKAELEKLIRVIN